MGTYPHFCVGLVRPVHQANAVTTTKPYRQKSSASVHVHVGDTSEQPTGADRAAQDLDAVVVAAVGVGEQ